MDQKIISTIVVGFCSQYVLARKYAVLSRKCSQNNIAASYITIVLKLIKNLPIVEKKHFFSQRVAERCHRSSKFPKLVV